MQGLPSPALCGSARVLMHVLMCYVSGVATVAILEILHVKRVTSRCAGCTRMPSFNHPGAHPPARCAGHREPGMVNVRHRTCRQAGCTTEVRALPFPAYYLARVRVAPPHLPPGRLHHRGARSAIPCLLPG